MDKMSLDQEMLDVLRGRATGRQTPSNMVRVFISSTFSGKQRTSSHLVEEYTFTPDRSISRGLSRGLSCPLDTSHVL